MFSLNSIKVWYSNAIGLSYVISYYNFLTTSASEYDSILKDISCYKTPDKFIDLQVDDNLNVTEETMFFLETSCKGSLDSKQACAVESASKANPRWKIFVLLTGPLTEYFINGDTFAYLSAIDNVMFARINVSEFTNGTATEWLFSEDVIKNSTHPVVHSADVLRVLVLNKYGGMYVDLDIIVSKSFDTLPKNFISRDLIGFVTSIIRLSKYGIGKKFSELQLEDLKASFKNTWTGNGPELIMRSMQQICTTKTQSQWSAKTCKGIGVLQRQVFHPIIFRQWSMYYKKVQLAEDWKSYGYHVWNSMSVKLNESDTKPDSLIAQLAKKNCPSIYEIYGKRFGSLIDIF